MTRLRKPSLATVLAALALFVSLSGTAMAAVIITSNSQVAAHTIAGARAPSGDNQNLISRSVGTSDLHTSAVTGTKIANGAVGTSKLNLPSINWYSHVADTGPLSLLKVDGLTVWGTCWFGLAANPAVHVLLSSTAVHPTVRGFGVEIPNINDTQTYTYPVWHDLGTNPTPIVFAEASSSTAEDTVVLTYRDDARVITLNLDMSTSFSTQDCDIHGTAIPAPN